MTASASQSVQLNDVKEAITCSICLQIYTDPRYLRCSHTFCLPCLIEYQTSSTWKECPVCRVDCIPTKSDLEKLPINQLAANLINLVKGLEPDAVEPATEWKITPKKQASEKPNVSSSTGQSLLSALSDSSSQLQQIAGLRNGNRQVVLGSREIARYLDDDADVEMAIARSLSEAEAASGPPSATSGPPSAGSGPPSAASGFTSGFSVGGDGSLEFSMATGVEHAGICCSVCSKTIRGERYVCGMCENFELCTPCSKKPRSMVHDPQHIFVKLKKPATAPPPNRPVLHEDSMVMGMSMDTESTEHKIPYGSRPIIYNCHSCGATPIRGVRYKCGNCQMYDLCEDCEKKSEEIHNPDHVFLVIPHPAGLHTLKPQLLHKFYSS